jgi:hypothetical protein
MNTYSNVIDTQTLSEFDNALYSYLICYRQFLGDDIDVVACDLTDLITHNYIQKTYFADNFDQTPIQGILQLFDDYGVLAKHKDGRFLFNKDFRETFFADSQDEDAKLFRWFEDFFTTKDEVSNEMPIGVLQRNILLLQVRIQNELMQIISAEFFEAPQTHPHEEFSPV